jgi:hypothetical protein
MQNQATATTSKVELVPVHIARKKTSTTTSSSSSDSESENDTVDTDGRSRRQKQRSSSIASPPIKVEESPYETIHFQGQQQLRQSPNLRQQHLALGLTDAQRIQSPRETTDDIKQTSLSESSLPSNEQFKPVAVVAIDLGTTSSGYAFSFTREPHIIHVMRRLEDGKSGVSNRKVPTVILFAPDGTFHSFGFAARNHYYSLDTDEASSWHLFDKFKGVLDNLQVSI